MVKWALIVLALSFLACEEDDMVCNTTIDCSDDKESLCDAPVVHKYENGDVIEIRACTYITYENCFEKTVCHPRGH